jgi:hypothetical protein
MNMATMDTIRNAKESIAASGPATTHQSMRIANWQEVTDATWLRQSPQHRRCRQHPLKSGRDRRSSPAATTVGNTQLTPWHGSPLLPKTQASWRKMQSR